MSGKWVEIQECVCPKSVYFWGIGVSNLDKIMLILGHWVFPNF